MPSLPVYDLKKTKVGTIELDDALFGADIKPYLLNMAVRAHAANKYRLKTANSLGRTDVSGTGKKIYRQKGTGQARHGDAKAPIFVGGGKAHGPRTHVRSYKINKKVSRAALASALSLLHKEDRVFVIDKLALEKHSTKTVVECLKTFNVPSTLFLSLEEGEKEKCFSVSTRNLQRVKCTSPKRLNVVDLLKFQTLMLSKSAAEKLMERFGNARNN